MNSKHMLSAMLVAGLWMASPVLGAENELEVKNDKSKNPLTGTVTETDEYKKKKTVNGRVTEEKVTETTKKKADGTVEKKVEADGSSKSAE